MFIIDAHLDLSMNAMEWNRDLRLPVDVIRAREHGQTDKPDRSRGTVSLPALRQGGIGLVVATQIARYVGPDNPLPGWHSSWQAWSQTQAQLAWYKAMEEAGEMLMIRDLAGLEQHVKIWQGEEGIGAVGATAHPIGYILSLEGADSLVRPDYLQRAYDYGLRAVGPAHYGPGRSILSWTPRIFAMRRFGMPWRFMMARYGLATIIAGRWWPTTGSSAMR
jgi:membrane dipeptidase